jgi:two-component system, cell cycle sensor histidine kinase and response regulator CckA
MKKARSSHEPHNLLKERQQTTPWPAEMCRRLIESSPWPMFVLDCELRQVVEANDAAVKKYQMNREDLRSRGVEEVLPQHRRIELHKLLDAKLDGPPVDAVSEHILPDQTLLPVEVRSFPLLWNERPSRFFIVRDLLARPPDKHNPRFSEKPDGPGRISGSAAHDFNNLLTVILAVAEQLQEGDGDPEQKINLIAKTVRSAQELARQRLSLGGSQEARRERLDLNTVLAEEADALGVLLGRHIDLKMDFDTRLWPVFADAGQWREVVLNLAMNARDAMPEGGELRISTHCQLFRSDDPELGLPKGRYVHLVVEDTGHGMSEETRLHAFQPYYSTKSRTSNTGLGLTSVDAVVRQSEGVIHLTSAPGEGTRFDIYIPALAESAQSAEPGRLLLLVEDSDELRKMIQEFLTAQGYEVIACGTAEAALKWTRTLARNLDLVICDILLPDLPGDMLVEQLREQRPEMKVIFMSGQRGIGKTLLPLESSGLGATCLEKPFSLHELAKIVAATLGIAAPSVKVDSAPATS